MGFLLARKVCNATIIVGTVLLLNSISDAQETILYTFTGGADGGQPIGLLVTNSAGNLYGATSAGGAFAQGTVFMVTPSGQETVLYSFGAFSGDGASPNGVVFDSAGNLYGTTMNGGAYNEGTVFELSQSAGGSWTEQILYSFCSVGHPQACDDGANPFVGVTLDSQGDIFGATVFGGGAGDNGVVFELVPNASGGYSETVIHDFTGGADGSYPASNVALDSAGSLYGEVGDGGSGTGLLGLVYKLTPQSGSWTYTVLLNFNGLNGGSPNYDYVILDSAGNIYATTDFGGVCAADPGGCGVVFELSPNGNGGYDQTRVYRFAGGLDGNGPNYGLSLDTSGDVFGSTIVGGGAGCGLGLGCGTIFELSPATATTWKETILNSFDSANGATPKGGVTLMPGSSQHPGKRGCPGGCYSSAFSGGKYNQGVVLYLTQ